MFGTILLALDGSPYAQRAAELVRRLADGGDDVIVLHVTEIMPIHGGINVDWEFEGLEAARRLGRELERAGVPHKVELVRAFVGDGAKVILEAARDHGAGVIVLDSGGRGDLSALLLGSVAHMSSTVTLVWLSSGCGRGILAYLVEGCEDLAGHVPLQAAGDLLSRLPLG
jgi:nucleotide-binding universal stress UspA family protein